MDVRGLGELAVPPPIGAERIPGPDASMKIPSPSHTGNRVRNNTPYWHTDEYKSKMWKGMPPRIGGARSTPEDERESLLRYTRALFPKARLRTVKTKLPATLPEYTVSHQIQHSTYAPVLTEEEADIPCAELDTQAMLDMLNELLETSYSFHEPGLLGVLEGFKQSGYDFGMAYGRIRLAWHEGNFATLTAKMEKLGNMFDGWRNAQISADGRHLGQAFIPPRRIWDLYSNRVIPQILCFTSSTGVSISGVSHAWVHVQERQLVETPINGKEWPVPIPNDISLSQVRTELLNVGLVYCWLDVLCLRQQGKEPCEEIRKEEWKVDVPTIGQVYQSSHQIAAYYSGLGRPFVIRPGDLDSERHWLKRAWTVQERSDCSLTMALCRASPERALPSSSDSEALRFFTSLDKTLATIRKGSVMQVFKIMQGCCSTTEVDRVAGLAYVLESHKLPIYSESQSPQEAWERLVQCMGPKQLTRLLFDFPEPGTGASKFVPSWNQVMYNEHPFHEYAIFNTDMMGVDNRLITASSGDSVLDLFGHYHSEQSRALCLKDCQVQGLSQPHPGESPRLGSATYMGCAFELTALHDIEIPDGQYHLIGTGVMRRYERPPTIWEHYIYWVIAKVNPELKAEVDGAEVPEVLEKVSVAGTCTFETIKIIGMDDEVLMESDEPDTSTGATNLVERLARLGGRQNRPSYFF